jgi:hypothetical protein
LVPGELPTRLMLNGEKLKLVANKLTAVSR